MTVVGPPTVPFVRVVKEGDVGPDIRAVKRALSRAGYMQWGEFTPIAGQFFINALNSFKKVKGLKQDGTYSFPTHEALRKTHRKGSRAEWAFDKLAIMIMQAQDVSPYERVVNKTLDAVMYAIINRDKMLYDQVRPMPDNAPYPNLPNPCDCSQFAGKWAPKSGNWLQDPNYEVGSSRKWDSYGFTGSLWDNGEHISGLKNAEHCDLVFYGTPWLAGGRAHVVMLREFYGGQWYAGSMGASKGPENVHADYRSITGIRRYKLV